MTSFTLYIPEKIWHLCQRRVKVHILICQIYTSVKLEQCTCHTQRICHTQIVFFDNLLHEFVYFSCIRNHDNPGFEYTFTLFLQKNEPFFLFRIIKFDCNIRQWTFPICLQTSKNIYNSMLKIHKTTVCNAYPWLDRKCHKIGKKGKFGRLSWPKYS
jgi:hypothetical protein